MSDILTKLANEVDKLADKKNSLVKNKKNTAITSKENMEVSVMEQLFTDNLVDFPEVGDTIYGEVIEISSGEIYLDLGAFGTGVVMGKEIKDGMGTQKMKLGDRVSATITEMENEEGYVELSIREASYEKAWEDIAKKKEDGNKIKTKVISANKGGLLVEINGISGFLPVSQLSSQNYPRVEDGDKNKILNLLKKLVGNELEVCILDTDRETEKLIVSEKAAQSEKEKMAISNFKIGDVIEGEISGVVDFGAFVKFSRTPEKQNSEEKIEGLVHISELAWQLIENPRVIVKVGDKVSAKVIGIDNDKISLSIRALQADPWGIVAEKYNIGDIFVGKVHKINHFGAFVYLDKDIHGLAHISEMLEKNPGKNINELIKVGEEYNWKILSIEPRDHRMGLALTNEDASLKESVETIKKNNKKKTVKKEAVIKEKKVAKKIELKK